MSIRKRLIQVTDGNKRALECILCHKGSSEGVHILGHFICESCERLIVDSRNTDPDYSKYLEGIKVLWNSRRSLLEDEPTPTAQSE